MPYKMARMIGLSFSFLLVALLVLVKLSQSQPSPLSQTLRVCPQGPPACDFADIQQALDAAQPHDFILIGPGDYQANLTLTKSVSLIATESRQARIRGKDPNKPTLTIKAQGDFRVTLEGLLLTSNPARRPPERSVLCNLETCPPIIGVRVREEGEGPTSVHLTLLNVEVSQGNYFGLSCDFAPEDTFQGASIAILNSRFSDLLFAAVGPGCYKTSLYIDRSVISGIDSAVGVSVYSHVTAKILNSYFVRGGVGIGGENVVVEVANSWFQGRGGIVFRAEADSRLEVRSSYFVDNSTGLSFGRYPSKGEIIDSVTVRVENSVFAKNRYGLVIDNPYQSVIEGNKIEENHTGILIFSSANTLQLNRNLIRKNAKWGVALDVSPCTEFGYELPVSVLPELFHIQGEDNEIYDNGQGNLCPKDFNWPPNFVKTPETP